MIWPTKISAIKQYGVGWIGREIMSDLGDWVGGCCFVVMSV